MKTNVWRFSQVSSFSMNFENVLINWINRKQLLTCIFMAMEGNKSSLGKTATPHFSPVKNDHQNYMSGSK